MLTSLNVLHEWQLQNPVKKDSKREPSSSKATTKRKTKDGDESQKKRKQKKKKDPNAPKRAKSAYMFFSEMEREVGHCFRNVTSIYDFVMLVLDRLLISFMLID